MSPPDDLIWRQVTKKITKSPLICAASSLAPPGFFINGGAKQDGVCGGAQEIFSWSTPSTLAVMRPTPLLWIDIKMNESDK